MKICCLEYDYSSFNGGAATYNRETAKLFNKHPEHFNVDYVQFDPIENENKVMKVYNVNDVDMDSYDIIIHGMVNCVKRPTDEILDLLVTLKKAKTVFLDHDRYPVYRTFYHQKKKARSAMACDFVITFHPFMYEPFVSDMSRVFEYNTWLNYRDVNDIPSPKPFNDREIDVMYQARIAPKKGSDGYLEFATKMKNTNLPDKYLGLFEHFTMYGFTGMPAEITCKKHPSVFTQIHKDPNKLIYNTPQSFIKLTKFVTDPKGVYDNFNNAKITWTAYKVSKQKFDINVRMHPGFEGGQLEALAAGTIIICNGIQRKLELCGKTLEDWDCTFFIDNNDTDQLVEDIKNSDLNKKFENLMKFRNVIFNDNNFINGWLEILNPIMESTKRTDVKVITSSTFTELKKELGL